MFEFKNCTVHGGEAVSAPEIRYRTSIRKDGCLCFEIFDDDPTNEKGPSWRCLAVVTPSGDIATDFGGWRLKVNLEHGRTILALHD